MKRTAKFHIIKTRKRAGLTFQFTLGQEKKKKTLLKKRYQRLTKISHNRKRFEVHITQIQAKIHNSEGRRKKKIHPDN